ncbi:unnamed protein product [Prorocentrum cordatum]|uniref:RanBP2-type domain-containing protein n=1 Tax=Prorocentrum cordatum TaxID=2364126 RepID=A0ABN9Y0F3_9DINO|nr:unnamed protein product [Polarella glacialis]
MSACARERSLAPPDGHAQDERWHCTQCGFWNKPTNTVCGGTGPMGCKAARPETVDPFLQAQALWAAQQASANARAGGASVDPDKWVCECGFANRLINTVCGGGGPLGCKQQRPGCVGAARTPADDGDSWTCSCGFVNSAKNVQCGGKGVLGCKKARAEQDRVLCLNMLLLSWRSIVQSYKLAGGLIWGAAG